MGKKGGKEKTVQTTRIPSWIEDYGRANLNYADKLTAPFLQNMSPEWVSPFQEDQIKAFDMARNFAGGSSPITANILGFDRYQAMADAAPHRLADFGGVAQMRAADIGATPQIQPGQPVTAQKFTDADINAYMNPYLQSVVDASLDDLNDSYQRNLAASNMRAAAAGAFGGGRHGIRDAQVADDYLRNVARTASGLRSQAFDAASGLIQGDQNRSLQAASMNQQADMQRALSQAQLDQQAALADLANRQQAAITNADLTMRGRLADMDVAGAQDSMRLAAINAMGNSAISAQNSQDQRALQNIALLQSIGDQQQAQYQAQLDAPKQALALRQQILSGVPHGMETTTVSKKSAGLGGLFDSVLKFLPLPA